MLILLAEYLQQFFSPFAVVQYLTLRGILGVMTALGISLLVGPWVIKKLNYHQVGQAVRSDGPESHLVKAGTPTMGGALILISILISTLLWADLSNHYVQAVIAVTLMFGAIGWVDDYRKWNRRLIGIPWIFTHFDGKQSIRNAHLVCCNSRAIGVTHGVNEVVNPTLDFGC